MSLETLKGFLSTITFAFNCQGISNFKFARTISVKEHQMLNFITATWNFKMFILKKKFNRLCSKLVPSDRHYDELKGPTKSAY